MRHQFPVIYQCPGVRDRTWLKCLLKNPFRVFKKVSIQSLLTMQPQDVLPDGRQDLCDGCPNKTYHNGKLVSACRKEEYIQFGDMISLKEKKDDPYEYSDLHYVYYGNRQ